jgi:MurNAc alpha-1-phosphate uridylyltransferase
MKAMILAAGHGKRMRPLTDTTPKPLLKVGGKSLIVWNIERLKKSGIKEFVINLGWLGNKIPQALGDGSKWGVNIRYSDEQQNGPLETAGGIIQALPLLGNEPFIVVNGDVWCDIDYQHPTLSANNLAHLVLVDNPTHNPQGDFCLQGKHIHNTGQPRYTFSGIGYYHPQLFANQLPGKAPLTPLLRDAIKLGHVNGSYFQGDWRDIGTPERLQELNDDLALSDIYV